MSGKLVLCDDTGTLPCVVAQQAGEPLHACHAACCVLPYASFTDQSTRQACPYPQTWHLGTLVLVNRFTVVKESFHPLESFNSNWITPVHHYYLQFSMTDVTVISVKEVGLVKFQREKPPEVSLASTSKAGTSDFTGLKPSNENPMESTNSHHTSEQAFVSQLFVVTHKDNLVVRSRVNSTPQLNFCAQVCFVGEPTVYKVCGEDLTVVSVSAAARGKAQSTEKPSHRYMGLLFMGTNVSWYPVLHPECAYRLIYPNCRDTSAFQSNIKSRQLRKVIDKHSIEECITVRDNAVLVRVSNGALPDTAHPLLVTAFVKYTLNCKKKKYM